MQSGKNKLYLIMAIVGGVVIVLGGVLLSMILREEDEVSEAIVMPKEAFVYSPEEEYGGQVLLSTELSEALQDISELELNEVLNRISAFFSVNYPEHETFGLVKGSYQMSETSEGAKIQVEMVSNRGAIVKLEMIGMNYEAEKTVVRLKNDNGEVVYEDTINWSEVERMDGAEEDEESVDEYEEEYDEEVENV